ncbi:MAG: hypothetical protein U0L25_03920 [Ligilactobacillus ruminis]|nr:hypothetical protein [Ligilactobacillus ruminis]
MKKYSLASMMLDLEDTDNYEDYEKIVFRFLDKNDLFFTDIDKIRSQLSELIDSKFISTKSIENLEMYLNNIKNRNIILPSMVSLLSALLSIITFTIQITKIDIFSKKLKLFTNSISNPLCFIFICILLFFIYRKLQQHKNSFIFNLLKKIITMFFVFTILSNMEMAIMCLPILMSIIVLLCLNEYSKYNKRYNEIIIIQKSIRQFKKYRKRSLNKRSS